MAWKCIECETTYQILPEGKICTAVDCPGMGQTGFLTEIKGSISSGEPNVPAYNPLKEAGLCVLLMDASGSMNDPAFPNDPMYNQLSRREIVARAAATGIFQLNQMTKKEDAYICAIRFDHTQEPMFIDTVANIIQKYKDSSTFASYILSELSQMNGGTNINAAIDTAKSLVNHFLDGDLQGMGNYTPFYHRGHYCNFANKTLNIPNARVLIYTDGQNQGPIINPFQQDEPDILMGIYIGDPSDSGAKQLRQVVSKCPIHGQDQFFTIDKPEEMATLRGIFRMASGTSGFCMACQNHS